MSLLRPQACLAITLECERGVASVGGDVLFVEWVICILVMEDVGDDGSHAILAFELGTLDALEALRVRLLPKNLLFVG